MVFGGFGPKERVMRRPIALLLAALVCCAAPARGAGRGVEPVTVLVATTVGENARRTMPPELWQKLIDGFVYARNIVHFAGSGTPTIGDCKAAKAAYAVTAQFDLSPRLPGLGQDPDRKYAMARVTLLNCITGVASPERTFQFESQPLSQAQAGDFEPNESETWSRTVQTRMGKLALEPGGLAGAKRATRVAVITSTTPAGPRGAPASVTVTARAPANAKGAATTTTTTVQVERYARIKRVDGDFVYLTVTGYNLIPNEIMQTFADKDGNERPYLELVITEVSSQEIQATFDRRAKGFVMPHVGDYLEPLGAPTPGPAPAPTGSSPPTGH
jgi:hypothetical protein